MWCRSLLLFGVWIGAMPWASASGLGWRHDGSGRFPEADPAVFSGSAKPQVTVDLPPGNGSPVIWNDRIYVTAEPHTLVAIERATGAELWRRDLSVAWAVEDSRREEVARLVRRAEELEVELSEIAREFSRLQREARRADGDAALAKAVVLSSRMDEMVDEIDAAADYRGGGEIDGEIGLASPTPAVNSDGVFVLFGNGALGAFGHDGEVKWRRWLGPPKVTMDGYHLGRTASPVLAGRHLVVGYERLTGLNPGTGEVVWRGGEYPHYGTVAVARVGGAEVVITPGGDLVSVEDGRVLQSGLGKVSYVGPQVDDDRVYLIGGSSLGHNQQVGHVNATAWTLVAGPDGPTASPLWSAELPEVVPVGSEALVHGAHVYVAHRHGLVWALDKMTGSVAGKTEMKIGSVYPQPVLVGGRLLFTGQRGEFAWVSATPELKVLERGLYPEMLATPVFFEGWGWFRARDGLMGYGPEGR